MVTSINDALHLLTINIRYYSLKLKCNNYIEKDALKKCYQINQTLLSGKMESLYMILVGPKLPLQEKVKILRKFSFFLHIETFIYATAQQQWCHCSQGWQYSQM